MYRVSKLLAFSWYQSSEIIILLLLLIIFLLVEYHGWNFQNFVVAPKTPMLLDHPIIIFDAYTLETGDHPVLSLVSLPLTTKNSLGWSQDIMTSFTAKSKEGFIVGTLPKPTLGDIKYKRWIKNDSMLKTLIRNCIFHKLHCVFSFAFASTSKALLDSIEDQFDQCNRVMLSKMKKDITN